MPSVAAMGQQAGHVVNALLDGAAPASVRLPATMPTILNVDWRQVHRWGIDERAIPGDAVVHFEAPTLLHSAAELGRLAERLRNLSGGWDGAGEGLGTRGAVCSV